MILDKKIKGYLD